MHQLVPDKRWKTLVRAVTDKKIPEDLYLQKVYRVMIGDTEDEDISFALDMIATPIERDYMVAYFLSGASHQYICQSLDLNAEVCNNFGHLYIDMSTFRHRLEILRYANTYMRTVALPDNVELINQAMRQGPEYITYNVKPDMGDIINVERMTARVLTQSFYTAGVARSMNIDSPLSRQALKWLGVATKLLAVAKDNTPRDTTEDALISILAVQQTQSLDTVNIAPENLVH